MGVDVHLWPFPEQVPAELIEAMDDVGLSVIDDMPGPATAGWIEVDTDLSGMRRYTWSGSLNYGFDGRSRGGDLLALLREWNIAFAITTDAKYEFDGSIIAWHPGMSEPFEAQWSNSGQVLAPPDYKALTRDLQDLPRARLSLLETFFAFEPFVWSPATCDSQPLVVPPGPWKNTAAALVEYDGTDVARQQMLDQVESNADVEAWQQAVAAAVEKVQEAFYADCVEQEVPNSRDHCRLVSIDFLRGLVRGAS